MKTNRILSVLFLAMFVACAKPTVKCTACEGQASSPSFDKLKKLAGTWENKTTQDGKEVITTATYEVTSGDNAVIEKIFVGTPHEMVSVYYPEGKTISMTHYCMLGNRPVMTLKNSSEGKLFFEMNGKNGIESKNERHMHALEVVWNGDNEFTQNWTSFDNGKKVDVYTLKWTRVASKK